MNTCIKQELTIEMRSVTKVQYYTENLKFFLWFYIASVYLYN